MEKDFLNWYKRKFNQLNVPPPDDAWENIANDLDMDEVWQGVDAELNKRDRRKTAAKLTAALALFVSLGGGLFLLTNKNVEKNKNQTVSQNTVAGNLKEKKTKQEDVLSDVETTTTSALVAVSKSTGKNNLSVPETKPDTKSEQKGENLIAENLSTNNRNSKSLIYKHNVLTSLNGADISDNALNSATGKNMLMTAIAPLFAQLTINDNGITDSLIYQKINDSVHTKNTGANTFEATDAHSFIIGVAFASANTWLLNNDTYNGLKAGTLNRTLFSYGKSYAVLVGYNLSNKYCLQTEWVINNTHNQQYVDFKQGHQVSRDLKVDYTQLNVLMKKKNEMYHFGNKLKTSFNFLAGLNYSYVKSFTEQTDESVNSIKNNYKNNQYNLILGLEYQVFIRQSWIISSGIRTNIGLQNIYKGTSTVPSAFNKTYDSSIGLNIGIGYKINRNK